MKEQSYVMKIDLQCDSVYRYRCRGCRRHFVVTRRDLHENGSVQCPTCHGDEVEHWLNRRDRIMRFLMFYEAA